MTSSLKDVSSADMVRNMAEMGCFEEAYTVYGYSWRDKNGKRLYRMSQDEALIQQAFTKHLLAHCCMTPVQQWTTRAILQEGSKEEQLFLFRLQLAQQLQQNFNKYYFDCLDQLQQIPADTNAEPLLLHWQAEIDGYFDEDALTLFTGAMQYAYLTKHLSTERYQQFQRWLQSTKKQMTGKLQMRDNFERTFYGAAYHEGRQQPYQFLLNANQKAFDQQVKVLKTKGMQFTPTYQKTYWYRQSTDLPKVRKHFEAALKDLLDDDYLERISALQNMPSRISDDLWHNCKQCIQKNCSAVAAEEFQFWQQLWNVNQ